MSKQTDLLNLTDAITVDGSNVGIGTSSPDAPLTIENPNVSGEQNIITVQQNGTGTSTLAKVTYNQAEDSLKIINASSYSGSYLGFGTNGSERMRIDASGRVTMPYQPAFNARGAESQTYTTTGWKQIFYPNSVSQRGSAYNSATSTFTAPVSAWYYFSITANFVSNSDGDGAISISKNGGTTDAGIVVTQSQNGGSFNGRSTSGVVYLTVNDYVNVWVYSTVNLTSRASTWAGHFSGYLIG